MNIHDINLQSWFCKRKLDHCPIHFTKTKTPVNKESFLWIMEKLHGRFCLISTTDNNFFRLEKIPAFENDMEAVLYELTWSN